MEKMYNMKSEDSVAAFSKKKSESRFKFSKFSILLSSAA